MAVKVLVIRFNSIGDIVLASPAIKALSETGHEVHFLVKKNYASLLENNPFVAKCWILDENESGLLNQLRDENFDKLVDLHNTLRSWKFKRAIGRPTYVLKKNRINDFLLTRLRSAAKPRQHIVKRYLDVVEPLTGKVDDPKTEFYFPKGKDYSKINLPKHGFISIAVSTAFETKNIPVDKLADFCKNHEGTIVLLGSERDRERAAYIVTKSQSDRIFDMTGKLSLDESAYVLTQSKLLLTGDTGLMHIATSLNVPVAAVFGSTHPLLGYTPFYADKKVNHTLIQNMGLSCRPCTRQGRRSCPKAHFKCMNAISVDEITKKVEALV